MRGLLREYHRHGDLGARSRLIQQYLPLVRRLARRHVGHGEQFEDLVQVGSIGLIKAIDRFQLERGVDLATYAIPTIDGEIKRHLRDRAWPIRIPRRLQELDPTLRARVAELVDGENGEFDRDSALERGYELGEDRIALASGFHVLDARERLLLRLAYFEGPEPGPDRPSRGHLPDPRLTADPAGARQAPGGDRSPRSVMRPAEGRPTIDVSEAFTQPSAEDRRLSSVEKRARGTVEEYTGLPYHLMLVRDGEDKGKPWTASVEELPGCTSHGKTSDEALDGIEAAMSKWIALALEEDREIPEPKSATSHSGRLLLRMPRTLHADLTRASEREGISLNQFITDVLAAAVAWRGRYDEPGTPRTTRTPLNQAPGADSLIAEASGSRRARMRRSTSFVTAALAANFVIVGIAGVVAIIVLLAALR